MENKDNLFSVVRELREDCARKQQKGLHFIITSVMIWLAISFIQILPLPTFTKNLYMFCCSAPLIPLAYLVSKLIKVDFQNKDNPLTSLGILFSVNQMLYILIVMWIYGCVPDKMLMVYAMIFGAHLLPYGWLYQSKMYYIMSILIPIMALLVGLYYSALVVAVVMFLVEIVFCVGLIMENSMYSRVQNEV
ncbi:DUF7010 family protein [Anaerosporobacter sp.]|uniref:DUF7010 family protein n=1 Tax=Anaerosporobacter sp. TaxID=1872529 RepID=UPI00286F87FB|nr:hypothetical protein [Anaerosporobacter sp.]